jgi:hypothetical protein
MGQGDVPTSRGGPLRRRREKRQLEHLAASSDHEGSPPPAAAHVKVIGDRVVETSQPVPDAGEPDPPEDRPPHHGPGGFHVRAVPIDQPLTNDEV